MIEIQPGSGNFTPAFSIETMRWTLNILDTQIMQNIINIQKWGLRNEPDRINNNQKSGSF
jgi:hypothetical protein